MSEHKVKNSRFRREYIDPSVFILLSRDGFDRFYKSITVFRNERAKKIGDLDVLEDASTTIKVLIHQAFTTAGVINGHKKEITFLRTCAEADVYLYDAMLEFVCFNEIDPLYRKMKKLKKLVEAARVQNPSRGPSALDSQPE